MPKIQGKVMKPTRLTSPISIVKTGSTRIRIFHTDMGDFTRHQLKAIGLDPVLIAVRARGLGWNHKDVFLQGYRKRKVPPVDIVSSDVKRLGDRPRFANLAKIKVGLFEKSL
jgi:hypothetical protein